MILFFVYDQWEGIWIERDLAVRAETLDEGIAEIAAKMSLPYDPEGQNGRIGGDLIDAYDVDADAIVARWIRDEGKHDLARDARLPTGEWEGDARVWWYDDVRVERPGR